MNSVQYLIDNLNNSSAGTRLDSLRELIEKTEAGELEKPARGKDVNNHIHTTYSFSPYSPSKAVWMAYNAGLATAGIMDHDSISGAREFIEAGRIAGIATTIGVECRADFSGTPLKGRRINNPDQKSVAYVALHGIPHTRIDRVREFFAPYSRQRDLRNSLMVEKINGLLSPSGVRLDYAGDIKPLSMCHEGGSVTERHILYGLSLKLISAYGKGRSLLEFIENGLRLNVGSKHEKLLADADNPYYAYDLLGLLKGEMVPSFYIDATVECPDIKEIIGLASSIGAISAYAYLGDVGDSVTGDKRSQRFEDEYLDELFDLLKELGFNAVTYMPSRNTQAQLARVMDLCRKYGLFQISGEDINSPRQSFVCEAMRGEAFRHLAESTWALIGHELEATRELSAGMFSARSLARYSELEERLEVFRSIGINALRQR